MKKILFTVINILLSGALLQAQIGNKQMPVSKTKLVTTGVIVSLAGSWSGTQTNDYGMYPQAFAFQLSDQGVLSMSDNKGTVAAQGTYTFANNVFNATYKQLSSNETFSIAGTYDPGTQKLTCTQGSGTASTGQGKITLSKVSVPVLALNNNIVIRPGIKTIGTIPPTPPATQTQSTGPNYGTTMYNSNTDLNEYYLKKATLNIWTGDDNKETPSCIDISLLTNWASYTNSNYIAVIPCGSKKSEYAVNSKTTFPLPLQYKAWDAVTLGWDYQPSHISLTAFQKNGLSVSIIYSPSFFLDAWKINKVELTVEFKKSDGSQHPVYGTKTIIFTSSALMTEKNNRLTLVTDKFLNPQN